MYTPQSIRSVMQDVARKEEYNIWVRQHYNDLIMLSRKATYRDELKFLVEMPYEQGLQWVKKCIIEFDDLHALDPVKYHARVPIDVVRCVREYRKEKNKAAKAAAKMKKEASDK